ncbi:MAG: DNA polymerase IV, partial [Bacteroidota bacterium]
IRKEIWETTQLTASAGVSYCKFLAKIASDINKPNGLKVILPQEAWQFIGELPIEKFFGIGKVTAAKMRRMGIRHGADLREYSEIELVQRFGKAGRHFYRIARGEDHRPVNPNRIRKSIGAERTYSENIADEKQMREKLDYVIDKVYDYMQEKQNFGRTITLKMNTPEFQIFTRSRSFRYEVREREQIRQTIYSLLSENIQAVGAVRLLGVSVSNLEREQEMEGTGIQLEIDFPQEEE